MQANLSSIFIDTVAPAALTSSSDALSVFAAGAISGAGVTYFAQEVREHLSRRFSRASDEKISFSDTEKQSEPADPLFGKPLTRYVRFAHCI